MNNITIQQQQISQIDQLKQQFKNLIDRREATYVEIGQTLNSLQDEFKEEGRFMEWLKSETRISYSTANRYMKVAREYKDVEKWAVILGVKKAYLLLKITDKDERFEFMKKHQVSTKSYDEINSLLMSYLNKEKESSTQKSISPKSAIKKLKKTIDKEVDNYNFIISQMGNETPREILNINDKLKEIQTLIIDIDDVETESPISTLGENDDEYRIFLFDDPGDEQNY